MPTLNVYLHGRKVGTLDSDNGRLSFRYDQEYSISATPEPLSFSLPIRKEAFPEEAIVPFFSNLLPDEGVRIRIAEILGLSPDNIFGLLQAIGEDCAGAVALFTPEKTPVEQGRPLYRPLSEDEADDVLTHLAERPLNIGAKDFHISGAGAQDKLVACVEKGRILLPLNGTPSTHIIKPGIERFPESVFNEYFCMKLAKACGLRVAECDILEIKGIPYYVVERYDREKVDGFWRRLHQEDFCQLLGVDPKIKYESEGGPGLIRCFDLMRRMELSAADTIAFLDQIIFCFLVGNGDAHAKNFSVVYKNGRAELAPAYDLLSTTVYPNLVAKLAMKIEKEYNFRWITHGKFVRMGQKAGISEKVIDLELAKLTKRITTAVPKVKLNLSKRHPADVYGKIQNGIELRLAQLSV